MTDLSISDERLECRAMNGIQLQEDCLLFLDVDPNLTVRSHRAFAAGMKFAVTYHTIRWAASSTSSPARPCSAR